MASTTPKAEVTPARKKKKTNISPRPVNDGSLAMQCGGTNSNRGCQYLRFARPLMNGCMALVFLPTHQTPPPLSSLSTTCHMRTVGDSQNQNARGFVGSIIVACCSPGGMNPHFGAEGGPTIGTGLARKRKEDVVLRGHGVGNPKTRDHLMGSATGSTAHTAQPAR